MAEPSAIPWTCPGSWPFPLTTRGPTSRGQGLATGLVRALVAGIRTRGERAFLHVAPSNTGAIRLYESMGFQLRARPVFTVLRVPPSGFA